MRIHSQLLEPPGDEMIVLALDIDDGNSRHGYSNSIVAGGLGVIS